MIVELTVNGVRVVNFTTANYTRFVDTIDGYSLEKILEVFSKLGYELSAKKPDVTVDIVDDAFYIIDHKNPVRKAFVSPTRIGQHIECVIDNQKVFDKIISCGDDTEINIGGKVYLLENLKNIKFWKKA